MLRIAFFATLVTITAAITPPFQAHAASTWQVGVANPLTRVQPTSPPGTSTAATLKAARNEYEAVQVIVRAPDQASLSGVNVAVSDLVGPGTIAKSNIRLYRAHYIPVKVPSAYQEMKSPNPPGDWADALVPSTVPGGTYPSFPFPVAAGKNQPVYVEVYVPKGTPAGTYTGTITVTATGQSPISVPLTLTVWGFTLPDKPALASDMWGYDSSLSLNYQSSTGSDLATLRQNIYTDYRNHRVGFGESGKSGPFPNTTLDAILQKQARLHASWGMTDAKLQELVRAYGSSQLYTQHHDEPKTQATIDSINNPNGETQRYRRNGVPELLTVSWSREGDYIGWTANVDIYAAVHDALVPFTNAQAKLNAGKRVWSYTTGLSLNENPSWNIDFDLINERIVPWLDYATGLTGFLYWTPVNWCPGDVWTNSGVSNNTCGVGGNPIDTNRNMGGVFYYPGDKVGAPNAAIPAARLKAIRDGVEDYNYLALLASLGDPALAKSLARTLAPAWDSWNHDPAALLAAREQAAGRILQLSGLPPDAIPPVISTVAVSGLTSTSATITWTTSEAADSQAEYGPTTGYGASSPLDPALVTSHTVTLTGLSAGTLYHYRVKSRDAAGNLAVSSDATFTTAGTTTQTTLVGYWPFEDGWGTLAADASGNGNTGTLFNGLVWSNGKLGRALSFDGVNDAVVVADSPSLDTLGAAFTVAAWIYGTDPRDSVDEDRAILGKGDTGWTVKNTLTLWLDSVKRLSLTIANGSSYNRVYGATRLQPNVWYHVVGTFDGSQLNVYVNGVRDAAPLTKTITGGLINAGTFTIGRQSPGDCTSPYNGCWKGLIDDVRVYNRALSATEVQALYNGMTP